MRVLFFLLSLTLADLNTPRDSFFESVLSPSISKCSPSGLISDSCCDFEAAELVNKELYTGLQSIVTEPFFRYHKIDLLRVCPFWQEDGSCMNRACGVETTEEQHIPVEWRSSNLGQLGQLKNGSDIPGEANGKDNDFCVLEDEADSEGQYVDLPMNPERFTGYAGSSASRVWKAIYEENCFTPVPFIDPSRSVEEGGQGFAPLSSSNLGAFGLNGGGFKAEEKKLLGSLAGPRDGGDETCLEKRVFYRLISGLHASISIHICADYLDQNTGLWSPNLECFITRIAQHPERLQNVYFSYVLLLRALAKSGPELLKTLESTASISQVETRTKLTALIETAKSCPDTFDETSMFTGTQAAILKSEFKSHFRNVSRIMDCVGCEKCRLWGKLQVSGLGTGLKLLFSDSEKDQLILSRGEVVSFVNTVHRFSESLHAVESFRILWANRDGEHDKVTVERSKEGSLPVVVSKKIESEPLVEEIVSIIPVVEEIAVVEKVVELVEKVEEIQVVDEATKIEEPIITPPAPPSLPSTVLEEPPSPIESPQLKKLVQNRLNYFSRWLKICQSSWKSCLELVIQYTSGTVFSTTESGPDSRTFLDEL